MEIKYYYNLTLWFGDKCGTYRNSRKSRGVIVSKIWNWSANNWNFKEHMYTTQ